MIPRNFRSNLYVVGRKCIATLNVRLLTKRTLSLVGMFLGGITLCLAFYCYLNALYLTDEILQGDALRELRVDEKTTILLRQVPLRFEDLNRFVLHYSICPTVHEIKILWPKEIGLESPSPGSFKFTKTHSLVTFIEQEKKGGKTEEFSKEISMSEIATEGVLLLDPDVYVSCTDIAFGLGVWRSGREAQAGFFPRLILPGLTDWQLLGWASAITHQAYSLMLPSGLFLKKEYLNVDIPKEKNKIKNKIENKNENKLSETQINNIKSFLSEHPHCEDYLIPLRASFLSPVPPIFIDVPVKIMRNIKLQKGVISSAGLSSFERNKCVTKIRDILDLEILFVATHKSTVAKTHLFW